MRINKAGYIEVKEEGRWILEHKKVAEIVLKRKLKDSEVIHHINQNKKDNRPSNLMLFENQTEHAKFHIKLKRFPYLTNPMKRQINELRIS